MLKMMGFLPSFSIFLFALHFQQKLDNDVWLQIREQGAGGDSRYVATS